MLDKPWLWYQRWLSLCAIALFVSTWRLWTPQADFPQIPLIAWACHWGAWSDWIAIGIILCSLVAVVFCHRPQLWYLYVAGWLFAVLLDQHRLQPWAYQFALMALLFGSQPPAIAKRWAKALILSIYLYSALGKFDAQFLNTMGQDLVAQFGQWLSLDIANWRTSTRLLAAATLPLGELLLVVLLAVPRLRWLGRWWATALHLGLLLALGPWGLNHRWGVLLWNLFFIGQTWLVFSGSQATGKQHSPETANLRGAMWVKCLIAFSIVWPVGERFGWCDHWLAWGLYAPHSSRAEWLFTERNGDLLPQPLRAYVELLSPSEAASLLGTDFADVGWSRLRSDRWSLAVLQAPVYPQARFQVGVYRAVVERFGMGQGSMVIVRGAADRWTGTRTQIRVELYPARPPKAALWYWNDRARDLFLYP